MIDFQKSAVYAWENKHIVSKVSTKNTDIEFISRIVNFIWNDLGYECPPECYVDPGYQNKSTGNRYELRFQENMLNEFVAIHELAHAVNQRHDFKDYDAHGPNYVADYCFLLFRYYRIDEMYLIGTLSEMGVKMNLIRFNELKERYGQI